MKKLLLLTIGLLFINVAMSQNNALKMELINEELCEANFIKTVSFNLIPLQLEGQDLLPLNIYGWNEQVIYEY